jgi:hypothetical protein
MPQQGEHMNEEDRQLDLALAECEAENRLLRARNERLERELRELRALLEDDGK